MMFSHEALTQAFPFLATLPAVLVIGLIVVLAAWTLILKGLALWHAARNHQMGWFIALLVINSLGILELVYLLAFRKNKEVLAEEVATSTQEA